MVGFTWYDSFTGTSDVSPSMSRSAERAEIPCGSGLLARGGLPWQAQTNASTQTRPALLAIATPQLYIRIWPLFFFFKSLVLFLS